MKRLFLLTLLAIAITPTVCQAKVYLPAVYSDNAVLKQNTQITLRGWSFPASGVRIVASWNPKDTIFVKSANTGKFTAVLKTPAGGFTPHSITFNGDTLMRNILIGEVWLCSGQSNMQWSVGHGIKDGAQHAAEANHPNLRIYQMTLHTADFPQEDSKEAAWSSCTPQTMSHSSAIGYFFARELMRELNVPVGIIVNAWGGSMIEPWLPSRYIAQCNDPRLSSDFTPADQEWHDDRLGRMCNALIEPLAPYALSGVIWYQGESNVDNPKYYALKMVALINGWRDLFGNSEMPFYMAQIAPFAYATPGAALIREAQQTASQVVPHSGLVVVSDLVNDVHNIHPTDKLSVGQRFAALALADTYGRPGLAYQYPMFASLERQKGGKTIIHFDHLTTNLKIGAIQGATPLKEIIGLQVVDKSGNTHPAKGVIKGNLLEVSADGVMDIQIVRYCFDNTTIGNLFDEHGMPVAPFSTDHQNRLLPLLFNVSPTPSAR